MRTFKSGGVDEVLRDIFEEEAFKEKLLANYKKSSSERRKRLSALASYDNRMAREHEEGNHEIEFERKIIAEFKKLEAEEKGECYA